MNIIVYRKLWMRGTGDDSCLYRKKDGCMCFLGFLGEAYGISKEEMDGRFYLAKYQNSELPSELFKQFSDKSFQSLEAKLAEVNDCCSYKDSLRELELKRLLEPLNIKVMFVN